MVDITEEIGVRMSIKEKLKTTFVYSVYRYIKYLIYPLKLKKAKVNNQKPESWSLGKNDLNGSKLIVSLTSFPERIHLVHKSLYSLMNQTVKPDQIILWLSTDHFPEKLQDLPHELVELMELGLSIEWLEGDIRSYKKLVPALKKYPKDILVTADDDLYYPENWLENLVVSYQQNPRDIQCQLVTVLGKDGNELIVRKRKDKYSARASYSYKLLGGSGTLYPPGSLHPDVIKQELFMQYAPTSDDIWFWAMALRNRTKIRWINNHMRELYYVENSQEDTACLTDINDGPQNLFGRHLHNVVEAFKLGDMIY